MAPSGRKEQSANTLARAQSCDLHKFALVHALNRRGRAPEFGVCSTHVLRGVAAAAAAAATQHFVAAPASSARSSHILAVVLNKSAVGARTEAACRILEV